MLFTLQEVQNEFKRVEDVFQSEVPASETSEEAGDGGYKQMLKAYIDIEETAFDVLYDEEIEAYQNHPQDYHLHGDDSRVDWGETYEKLQAIK